MTYQSFLNAGGEESTNRDDLRDWKAPAPATYQLLVWQCGSPTQAAPLMTGISR